MVVWRKPGMEQDARVVFPLNLVSHNLGSHVDEKGSECGRVLKQRISIPGQPLRVPLSSFTEDLMEQAVTASRDLRLDEEKSLFYQWLLPELGVGEPVKELLTASWKSASVPVDEKKEVDVSLAAMLRGDDREWRTVRFVAFLLVQLEVGDADCRAVYKYVIALYHLYLMRPKVTCNAKLSPQVRDIVVRRQRRVAGKLDKLAADPQLQRPSFGAFCDTVEAVCRKVNGAVHAAAKDDLQCAAVHRRLPKKVGNVRIRRPFFAWPEEIGEFCKSASRPVSPRAYPLEERASCTGLRGMHSILDQLRKLREHLATEPTADPKTADVQRFQALVVAERFIFELAAEHEADYYTDKLWQADAQAVVSSFYHFILQYNKVWKRQHPKPGPELHSSSGSAQCPHDPELHSRKVLVHFCVMAFIDALLFSGLCKQLGQTYGPPLDPRHLEMLLLTDRVQVEAALRVSQYLQRRSDGRPRRMFGCSEDLVCFATDYARVDTGLSECTRRVIAAANARLCKYEQVEVPHAENEEARFLELLSKATKEAQLSEARDREHCRENHLRCHWYCTTARTDRLRTLANDYRKCFSEWSRRPPALVLPLPEGSGRAHCVVFFAHMPLALEAAADVAALSRTCLLVKEPKGRDRWKFPFRPVEHYRSYSAPLSISHSCRTDSPSLQPYGAHEPELQGVRVVRRPGYVSDADFFAWTNPVDQTVVAWDALMQDSKTDFWAAVDLCTWQVNPPSLRQWLAPPEAGRDNVKDNEVLARQWMIPQDMTKQQWFRFGSIRGVTGLQLRRIADALRERAMDLCTAASRSLVLQALTQAGPVDGSARCPHRHADSAVTCPCRLAWRRDLCEQEWTQEFAKQLLALVAQLSQKHYEALLLAVLVANYMVQFEPQFTAVLVQATLTAEEWERDSEAQLEQLSASEDHQAKLEKHLREMRRTFLAYQIVGRRVAPRQLPEADARKLLRARVSLSDKELHEGPLCDRELSRWVDETMVAREEELLRMGDAGADIFSHALPPPMKPAASWQAAARPHVQGWSDDGFLQLDLHTGVLRINGERSMRLPDHVLRHELYVRVFGWVSPTATRSGQNTYRTTERLCGRFYELSMLKGDRLCARRLDESTDDDRVLIPPGMLPLPPALRDECSHWFRPATNTVEVCGRAHYEHNVRYIIEVTAFGPAAVKIKGADLHLVPHENEDLRHLMRVLTKFDGAQHVLPWCTPEGQLRRVDFQRGTKAWFSLTVHADGSLRDSSGRILRIEQLVPVLCGFENYLTFETTNGEVETVIPNGKVERTIPTKIPQASDEHRGEGDDKVGNFWSNIVFRALRPDENPYQGIHPKNPMSGRSLQDHIAHGSMPNVPSAFVSTSRDPASALRFASNYEEQESMRVCAINLAGIDKDCVRDVSTDTKCVQWDVHGRAKAHASRTHEVCVKGSIPADAILATVRLDSFLKPGEHSCLQIDAQVQKLKAALRGEMSQSIGILDLTVTDQLGAPGPEYFRYVLDPDLSRLRPAERGSAHAALFLALIHVLTSTELPEELTGETGMEAALELLRQCRQNHPYTEQERELLRRIWELGHPDRTCCLALQHAVCTLDWEARAVSFMHDSEGPASSQTHEPFEMDKLWCNPVVARRAKLRLPRTLWPTRCDRWDEVGLYGSLLGEECSTVPHWAKDSPFANLGQHQLLHHPLQPIYPLFDATAEVKQTALDAPKRYQAQVGPSSVLTWAETVDISTFGHAYELARQGGLTRSRLSFYALHADGDEMKLLKVLDLVCRAPTAEMRHFPAFPASAPVLARIPDRARELQNTIYRIAELRQQVSARDSALKQASSALSAVMERISSSHVVSVQRVREELQQCEANEEARRRELNKSSTALDQTVQTKTYVEAQLAKAKKHKEFFDRLHELCARLDKTLPTVPRIVPADSAAGSTWAGAAQAPTRPQRMCESCMDDVPLPLSCFSGLHEKLESFASEQQVETAFPLEADDAVFTRPSARLLLDELKSSYATHKHTTGSGSAELLKTFEVYYTQASETCRLHLHPQGRGRSAVVRMCHDSGRNALPPVYHQLRWIAMDTAAAADEVSIVNPLATAEDVAVVLEQLTIAAVCLTYRHKLQRIIQLERAGGERAREDIAAEIENRRNAQDTLEHPEWLLFEVENRIRIRPRQLELANLMCTQNKNLWQLNMGEGKSKVIIPMIISRMAGKGPPVRVIVPSPLFRQTYEYLRSVFSGLLRRKVYTLPFHRGCKLDGDEDRMAQLRSQMQECEREGGVFVLAPEHCNSLRLRMLVEAHRAERAAPPGGIDLLRELCHLVDAPTCDILDECDELLRPRYQLIYAEGSQQPVAAGSLRWRVPMAVFRVLKEHISTLERTGGGDFIRVAGGRKEGTPDETPDAMPEVRILATTITKQLSDCVLSRLLTDTPPEELSCLRLASKDREKATRFVTEPDTLPDSDIDTLQKYGDEAMNALLILRGLFAYGVLGHALMKRHRVDYGLYPESGKCVAVPFSGKDEPRERTEFQNSDVMIALTCLSTYYTGLTEEQVGEVFRILLKDSVAGAVTDGARCLYDRWLRLSRGRFSVKDSTALGKLEQVDCKDLCCRVALHRCFRRNTECINFFLDNIVFPKEAVQFPQNLICNAWHLSDGRSVVGFSGTNDNRMVLPSFVEQGVIESLKGTNGKMVELLTDPSKGNTRCELAQSDDPDEVLRHVIGSDASVLLDAGACIVGKTNRQVAEYVLHNSDRFRGALFFDATGRMKVLDKHGGCHTITNSPIALRDCFIYLDDTHTRGTDLKLAPKAVAVLTLGKDMPKDKLMQAAMRMRQLGQGQTVRFWCPRDVFHLIPKKSRPGPLNSLAVLQWVLGNTARALEDDMVHWARQGIEYDRQMQAHRAIGQWADSDCPWSWEEASDRLGLIHEAELMELKELFGHSVAPEQAPKLVNTWCKKSAERIGRHGEYLGGSEVVGAVLERANEFLGRKYVQCSRLDSECEREIEQVCELEIEKERPCDAEPVPEKEREWACALDPWTPLSQGFLQHVTLEHAISCVPGWREQVEAGLVTFNVPSVEWKVYASGNFSRTVTRTSEGGHFIRPVEWVLTKGTEAVLVSGFEAGRFLSILRQRDDPHGVCLHQMPSLFDRSSYPPQTRSLPFNGGLRRTRVVMLLIAGRCGFDHSEKKELRAVLGKIDPASADVAELCNLGVATPCGFVCRDAPRGVDPEAIRSATATRAFRQEPTLLIENLLDARDTARNLPHSDLQRVLRGLAEEPRAAHADPAA
eukprot:TRINITY_DN8003_c0_g1_i3.p1 TRINITY_DN8003_c0_g1~~TRINITY_DN8003_c0_g1_i3.p1  ORF type:complete len:3424 (+),score=752.41 TRINITY_DN8003_c0_g1_i3:510-10274(+)